MEPPSSSHSSIEWEAHRVAAAFALDSWARDAWFVLSTASAFTGTKAGMEISWRISQQGKPVQFRVGNGGAQDCIVGLRVAQWWGTFDVAHHQYVEVMARGLYCLGLEGEGILEQLDYPLSAHDKMELRLEMPREFWPPQWSTEETS